METKTAAAVALPDDVLEDILGRLPARSLAASQHVCKAWRDVVNERRLLLRLRRLLPHSVRGLFVNYNGHNDPHFLTRLRSSAADGDGGPWIDNEFRFIADKTSCLGPYDVFDHYNGLVLYRDWHNNVKYVCNPITRRWARLPPCAAADQWGRRTFIVFDPAVSPHYEVLVAPQEPESLDVAKDVACHSLEWPPSPWTWHRFSSRTGSWKERVFVREGEAAGTVGELLLNPLRYYNEPRWRYAAYWQGVLYMHCRGEFISRMSLSNDTYQVIRSPIGLVDRKNIGLMTFLGRSEKGVYFAAIDDMCQLRVWVLGESQGDMEWVLKHRSNLKRYVWWLQENYDQPKYKGNTWILDAKEEALLQENEGWNSDDDNIIDVPDARHNFFTIDRYISFLGFHPYKEVIFLCAQGYEAVACHLNNSKVQYLGNLHPGSGYRCGVHESFVYTPSLLELPSFPRP